MPDLTLALDIGTTSLRAVLFDPQWAIAGQSHDIIASNAPHPPAYLPLRRAFRGFLWLGCGATIGEVIPRAGGKTNVGESLSDYRVEPGTQRSRREQATSCLKLSGFSSSLTIRLLATNFTLFIHVPDYH